MITEAALEKRELGWEEASASYIYSLDWFNNGPRQDYYIDSVNFGASTRFINHSCNPNCRTYTVMFNKSDRRVYSLAIFAIRDVPAREELSIDYNPQNADTQESFLDLDDGEMVPCHCGAKNCRIRLWPGPKKRKSQGY